MFRRVVLSSILALFIGTLNACVDGPTAPSNNLSISPSSVSLRVGDSQNFVVNGGGGDYDFYAYECSGGNCTAHSGFVGTFKFDKLGPREAKLTILARNAYNSFFFVTVSGGNVTSATVYVLP